MPAFPNAALCGIGGAIAAHLAYVWSNLFLLGDVTRRGRHIIWDPAFFDGMGLVWGVVVGIQAARLFAASPGKAVMVGLGVTLLGIGVAGGTTTISRYRALPREPMLEGERVVLEFELRLPADRDQAEELPASGVLGSGLGNSTDIVLSREAIRLSEGRIIMPGHVRVRQAESPRLLSIHDRADVFVNFMLPLAATPTEADVAWTVWESAVNVEPGLPATQVFQIRYRVRFGSGG